MLCYMCRYATMDNMPGYLPIISNGDYNYHNATTLPVSVNHQSRYIAVFEVYNNDNIKLDWVMIQLLTVYDELGFRHDRSLGNVKSTFKLYDLYDNSLNSRFITNDDVLDDTIISTKSVDSKDDGDKPLFGGDDQSSPNGVTSPDKGATPINRKLNVNNVNKRNNTTNINNVGKRHYSTIKLTEYKDLESKR